MSEPLRRSRADSLISILKLDNEINLTKMHSEIHSIGIGVSNIELDVGDIKVNVSEISHNVALLLEALPAQMKDLRAGLESLVAGSVGAMLCQGVAEELMPLREEIAGLGAAMGDQVTQ